MKTYLKNTGNWVVFIIMLIALTIIYCTSKPETPSPTVDEIIELNRQIRIDTTVIDSTKV